jgi:hypothetical protein
MEMTLANIAKEKDGKNQSGEQGSLHFSYKHTLFEG